MQIQRLAKTTLSAVFHTHLQFPHFRPTIAFGYKSRIVLTCFPKFCLGAMPAIEFQPTIFAFMYQMNIKNGKNGKLSLPGILIHAKEHQYFVGSAYLFTLHVTCRRNSTLIILINVTLTCTYFFFYCYVSLLRKCENFFIILIMFFFLYLFLLCCKFSLFIRIIFATTFVQQRYKVMANMSRLLQKIAKYGSFLCCLLNNGNY